MLTPESCRELLALYEAMAEAAVRNDWSRLAELEAASSELRKAAAAAPADTAGLPDAAQREMATMIQRMLELDADVRSHAEPFLESTRKLLSGTIRRRNVRDTYGNI
ncbi:flagellar protein FliT [Thauera sp. SDU_THAU2]|uniref:flagellar protein FliT n=1 Tax=Thauera sp. SDU_THAU2 TaxID=3136633 RepID=UPI00311DDEEE